MQNISHAVMAQRHEAKDSFDDFPTPPWATRALFEHVLLPRYDLSEMSCLEPACGVGHMTKVLMEYFGHVGASDIRSCGHGEVRDFLENDLPDQSFDWVITNPPFRRGEEFVNEARRIARTGVALFNDRKGSGADLCLEA